jgi:hypothetical protein
MKLTGEGKSLGRALSDYTVGREKIMILIENGYQKLSAEGTYASTTNMLTVGNIGLDANGVSIVNIKSLSSANGTWSIDENGRIVAKVLCLDDVCIDKSILTNILNAGGNQGVPAVVGPQLPGNTGTSTATSTDGVLSNGTSADAGLTVGTSTDTGTVLGISTSTEPTTTGTTTEPIPPIVPTDTGSSTQPVIDNGNTSGAVGVGGEASSTPL